MQTFNSKIDWWLIILFVIVFGYPISDGLLSKQYGLSFTMFVFLVLIGILFSKIKYVIDGQILKIWWIKVEIKSIKRIYKTRNPLSSPALSLDRIAIVYNKYDTILLLMNGTGIFGKLNQISIYLQKLKNLLNEGGQILIDSSDIIYMFDQDEDGAYEVNANGYYGELTFFIEYKGEKENEFNWLYLDYNTLQNAAHANGLKCELVLEGEHFDYLARLSV
jgi:hypothetical protein